MLASISLFAVFLSASAVSAGAQDSPELIRSHGDANGVVLVNVKAVLLGDVSLIALTDPEPAVHALRGAGLDEWGREGRGPAELKDPVAITWAGKDLLVLDQNQQKLVSYRADGAFLSSRALGGVWANRVFVVGADTVLGTFTLAGSAVVRLRGSSADTILAFNPSQDQLVLKAAGAPSLTLPQPFAALDRWTLLPGGVVAHWQPEDDQLHFYNIDGKPVGQATVPAGDVRVSEADREYWVETAIPEDFMGRRVFEPLRPIARDRATFPRLFPAVLNLLPDPNGNVWIQRSVASSGESWISVDRAGRVVSEVELPVGRELLAVGREELAVLSKDEWDIETIELYARPSG